MFSRLLPLAMAFWILGAFAFYWGSPIGYALFVLAGVGVARFGWQVVRAELRGGADGGVAGDLPLHVRKSLEGRKKP